MIQGANGAAGEIGYSLRGMRDDHRRGRGHAPLEEFAGGRALGRARERLFGTRMTAAEVFDNPDPRARELLESALDALAVQVANLAIAIDPERIAVGGGLMSQARRRARPRSSGGSRAAVPFPPELVAAAFVHDGAAARRDRAGARRAAAEGG